MRNWDEHYSDPANLDFAPEPLLVVAVEMLPPGDALDLACGVGRNAIYLARLGWRTTAVDASEVAIARLRQRAAGLAVDARVADLEDGAFRIAPDGYDLIADFFYLQRDLFPQIRAGLRPGGVFTGAIHLFDPAAGAGPHNPAFLMHPGELRDEFAGWKIVYYSEGGEAGKTRRAARIIARHA